MWKSFLVAGVLAITASAQTSAQLELANLREDVRGLVQRVGELTLRLEQLERENAELRQRAGAADRSYATLTQVNAAIAEASASLRGAIAVSKHETLQQVGAQLEKLGKQTNAALDSLAKGRRPRDRPVQTNFADDYVEGGRELHRAKRRLARRSSPRSTGAKQQDIINANKLSRILLASSVGQTLFIPGGK